MNDFYQSSLKDELFLIQQSQEGSEKAFEELMTFYEPMLKQQCHKLRIDESATEDVIQEIYIQIYKNIKKFEGRSKFSTWLYRITHNTALNYIRKRNRLKEHPYQDEIASEPFKESLLLSNDKINKDEYYQLFDEALKTLSERHQIVIKMYELEQVTQKEIAKKLRIKEGTVRSRLHYARKKIKQYVQEKQKENLP